MKISRRGSGADHGLRSINLDNPRITWNKNEELVEFYQDRIGDFATTSTHDYTIQIPLSEIKKIIEIIGDKTVNESPDTIANAFSTCLRELVRIEKACIGNIGLSSNANESQNA